MYLITLDGGFPVNSITDDELDKLAGEIFLHMGNNLTGYFNY